MNDAERLRRAGLFAARRLLAVRPHRAKWAASKKQWLAAPENLSAIADWSATGSTLCTVAARREASCSTEFECEPDPWRAGDERDPLNTVRTVWNAEPSTPRIWASGQSRKSLPSTLVWGSFGESGREGQRRAVSDPRVGAINGGILVFSLWTQQNDGVDWQYFSRKIRSFRQPETGH
jgi:hypothetical protein